MKKNLADAVITVAIAYIADRCVAKLHQNFVDRKNR